MCTENEIVQLLDSVAPIQNGLNVLSLIFGMHDHSYKQLSKALGI